MSPCVLEGHINVFAICMLWVCEWGDIWLDVGANVGCAGNERVSPSPNNHQWWHCGEGGGPVAIHLSALLPRCHTPATQPCPSSSWFAICDMCDTCDSCDTCDMWQMWQLRYFDTFFWWYQSSSSSFDPDRRSQASAEVAGWFWLDSIPPICNSILHTRSPSHCFTVTLSIRHQINSHQTPHSTRVSRAPPPSKVSGSFHWSYQIPPNLSDVKLVLEWEFISASVCVVKFKLMPS